jgi:hypothetical protein
MALPEASTLLAIAPPESLHVHTVCEGVSLRITLKPGGYRLYSLLACFAALGIWLAILIGLPSMLVLAFTLLFPMLLIFAHETVLLTPEGLHTKLRGDFDDGIHPWATVVNLTYDPFSTRYERRTISYQYLPYNFLVGLGRQLDEKEARAVIRTIQDYRKMIESKA